MCRILYDFNFNIFVYYTDSIIQDNGILYKSIYIKNKNKNFF